MASDLLGEGPLDAAIGLRQYLGDVPITWHIEETPMPNERQDLSRRERQIVDALHRLGGGSAVEIRDAIPEPPTTTAVRTLLRILEQKGHVRRRQDGPRYIYSAAEAPARAQRGALRHVLQTFFGGSPEDLLATLVDLPEARKLRKRDLARLNDLVRDSSREDS
jgi:predicted transcriptional regulator